MESTLPAIVTDDSFFESLDRYVRQVAYDYDLPEIVQERTLINKIDLSMLSLTDQRVFNDWLDQQFYTRISIENALRRGLLVEARLIGKRSTDKSTFLVRINGL